MNLEARATACGHARVQSEKTAKPLYRLRRGQVQSRWRVVKATTQQGGMLDFHCPQKA